VTEQSEASVRNMLKMAGCRGRNRMVVEKVKSERGKRGDGYRESEVVKSLCTRCFSWRGCLQPRCHFASAASKVSFGFSQPRRCGELSEETYLSPPAVKLLPFIMFVVVRSGALAAAGHERDAVHGEVWRRGN
jgi:hypothetical protein